MSKKKKAVQVKEDDVMVENEPLENDVEVSDEEELEEDDKEFQETVETVETTLEPEVSITEEPVQPVVVAEPVIVHELDMPKVIPTPEEKPVVSNDNLSVMLNGYPVAKSFVLDQIANNHTVRILEVRPNAYISQTIRGKK